MRTIRWLFALSSAAIAGLMAAQIAPVAIARPSRPSVSSYPM